MWGCTQADRCFKRRAVVLSVDNNCKVATQKKLGSADEKGLERNCCKNVSVCCVVPLAGVCGLKEDPHMSINNKTDTGCLRRTLPHACINANAHTRARDAHTFPLQQRTNNALRMWLTRGPRRERQIGNEG